MNVWIKKKKPYVITKKTWRKSKDQARKKKQSKCTQVTISLQTFGKVTKSQRKHT